MLCIVFRYESEVTGGHQIQVCPPIPLKKITAGNGINKKNWKYIPIPKCYLKLEVLVGQTFNFHRFETLMTIANLHYFPI